MAEPFAVDSPLVLFQRGNLVMSELEDDAAAGKATNARCAARDKWVTCDRRNQWARGDSFASLCIIGLLTLIVIAFIQRRTTKREYRATTGEAQGSSATQPPAIVASRMK